MSTLDQQFVPDGDRSTSAVPDPTRNRVEELEDELARIRASRARTLRGVKTIGLLLLAVAIAFWMGTQFARARHEPTPTAAVQARARPAAVVQFHRSPEVRALPAVIHRPTRGATPSTASYRGIPGPLIGPDTANEAAVPYTASELAVVAAPHPKHRHKKRHRAKAALRPVDGQPGTAPEAQPAEPAAGVDEKSDAWIDKLPE